jgi:hypothetical protein
MFQSCGNEESANSKKNQTPKTACECIDYYAKEVKKIADMTDEQFAKSENEIEKIAAKMDADTNCNKLIEEQQKKFKSPEEFQKEFEKACPSLTVLIENMMKVQNRMMQNMQMNATEEAMQTQEF